MSTEPVQEVRRQIGICNACRYCEGYCSVFPAITRQRMFADGDITQLANLCHNCRGCFYACQYTEPHEFALNLPAALAEVRHDSWAQYASPAVLVRLFDRSGVAIALFVALALGAIIFTARALRPEEGEGFYVYLSHGAMVAVFAPAFLLPLLTIAVAVSRYWRAVGGQRVRLGHLLAAFSDAARLKDLSGGQGQGCNFERGDRYSNTRRWLHQATLYGFLLCLAATAVAAFMHFALGVKAPYGLFSAPKLLGLPGGVLLAVGAAGLGWLKTKADRALGSPGAWGGEMAFILLLFFVAASGLALYAASGTAAVPALLGLHLGSVLAFFLLMPYSKMIHGFLRLTAIVRNAQQQDAG